MDAPPHEMAREVSHALIKAAPPVTVWWLTLNEWVAVASILYIALQAAYLVAKWRREAKARRRAANDT